MQLHMNYKDALILRDDGINALTQALGAEQTKKFLALFNYYDVSAESEELLIKDYTEWRRTQSFYNDPDMDDAIEYCMKNPERSWHRNETGEIVYDDEA